ncbi:hypothetical protein GWN42_24125 [candidate division KSB1 bacterium]|nr:hypothetical protein [candidate division KSB1 bacterium]
MKEEIFEKPLIAHEVLVKYIKGETDEQTEQQIEATKNDHPTYELLLNLIDKYKHHYAESDSSTQETECISLSAIEELLLQIFSKDLNPQESQKVINGLLNSADFYQRFISKLDESVPFFEAAPLPEMDDVEIPSDETIVAKIVSGQRPSNSGSQRRSILVPTVQKLLSKIGQWLHWLVRNPASGGLVAATLILAIVLPLIFRGDDGTGFVYDDRVPYHFEPIKKDILRGMRSQGVPETSNKLDQLYARFLEGMLEYKDLNYDQAITILEKIQPEIESLEKTAQDELSMRIIRDYYFYSGLSHLALAQSEESADTNQSIHLRRAIENLDKAKTIETGSDLDDDQAFYFLGVAYGLTEQYKRAVSELRNVSSESSFYKESVQLINQWSKK